MSELVKLSRYRVWKGGELVWAISTTPPFFAKQEAVTDPISLDRVFAVDTESAFKQGELVTDLVPIAFRDQTILLDHEDDPNRRIAERFVRLVVERYGIPMREPSWTKQRRRRGPRKHRDGRRQTIPLTVSVWFNLPYDIGRLFPHRDELRAIHAGADSFTMKLAPDLSIEWLRYVEKSAPQFHWIVRDETQGLVLNLIGIDLTGYWKCSLDAAAKSLRGVGKIDIENIVPGVHERPFESFTAFERDARRSYAIHDAEQTAFVYRRTVEELCQIDSRVIRKNGVLPPSAPSAAARIMFSRAFDLHPEIEAWAKPPIWADQLGANAYYGGRSFVARPGRWKGLQTLDRKSAYPFAMAILPDPVTAEYVRVWPGTFELDRYKGKFGVLVVSGRVLDERYPPFRDHDLETGKLRYLTGTFSRKTVTIPELVIGVCRGALEISQVHEGVIIEGSCESSFLRSAVLDLYALKEREGKSPLGLLAKLLMNSTYGKLIEIVVREMNTLSLTPVPRFTGRYRRAIAASMLKLDLDPLSDPADLFFSKDTDEAKRLFRVYAARPDPGVVAYAETCAMLHPYDGGCSLSDFVRKARSHKTGHYFLPLYAAQITGLTSAVLGSLAASVGAYCGDTDSVHFPCEGAPIEHPGVAAHFSIMGETGYPEPRTGLEIAPGCNLGSWENDSPGRSLESIIVRPKVYSHRFTGDVYKQAFHGIAKFTCTEAELARKGSGSKDEREGKARALRQARLHEELSRLLAGEPMAYQTRAAPRRGRTAIANGSTVGEFTSRLVSVANPPVIGTELDADGWVRWAS